MKDLRTPAPVDEIRVVIKKCLETASLVNYTKISEQAKIEGMYTYTHIYIVQLSIKLKYDSIFVYRDSQ